MAGENELIEISLLSGQSDRAAVTFTPGTPANPVSVGTAGQWIVNADGVGPVHLYLVFDGRSVHVASAAPNAHVLLAGLPVGASWAKAPIPCELRFGGACVIMRSVGRAPAYAEEERTVHDGGALWQAAQKVVQDAIERAKHGPSEAAPQLGGQFPPPRPAAGAPSNLGETVPMGDQQAFRDALAKAHSSAPPTGSDDAPTTIRAPLQGGPHAGEANPPLEVTMIAPQPLLPRPASTSAPADPRLGGAGPSIPQSPAYPPLNLQPATPTGGATPQVDTSPGSEPKVGYWQSASAVKKATLIMMPLALVMSYFMLQPEAPPPPPKVIASARASGRRAAQPREAGAGAAALAAGSDAGLALSDAGVDGVDGAASGDAATDQTTTVAVTPANRTPDLPPKMTPLPRGTRTPERQALDAVALGSFDDASKLYTALAAAHPDDPSYKDAARILREKTGQTRGNSP